LYQPFGVLILVSCYLGRPVNIIFIWWFCRPWSWKGKRPWSWKGSGSSCLIKLLLLIMYMLS